MSAVGILVIDDDEGFRRLVSVMLSTAGYEVQEAADGPTGVDYYRQQRSDVVITDMMMPHKEGGLETVQALMDFDPDAKIIVMSSDGVGRFGYLNLAAQFGARQILSKPFTRDELLAAVTAVLSA